MSDLNEQLRAEFEAYIAKSLPNWHDPAATKRHRVGKHDGQYFYQNVQLAWEAVQWLDARRAPAAAPAPVAAIPNLKTKLDGIRAFINEGIQYIQAKNLPPAPASRWDFEALHVIGEINELVKEVDRAALAAAPAAAPIVQPVAKVVAITPMMGIATVMLAPNAHVEIGDGFYAAPTTAAADAKDAAALLKLCDQLEAMKHTMFRRPGTGQHYSYLVREDVYAYVEQARAAIATSADKNEGSTK